MTDHRLLHRNAALPVEPTSHAYACSGEPEVAASFINGVFKTGDTYIRHYAYVSFPHAMSSDLF
jgi:hypothetical protein